MKLKTEWDKISPNNIHDLDSKPRKLGRDGLLMIALACAICFPLIYLISRAIIYLLTS